jgi:hypothetical protein
VAKYERMTLNGQMRRYLATCVLLLAVVDVVVGSFFAVGEGELA